MTEIERFVDADRASEFVSLPRRRLLELTRLRELPGHPIGRGKRHIWLYRLSELADAMAKKVPAGSGPKPSTMPSGGSSAVPKAKEH